MAKTSQRAGAGFSIEAGDGVPAGNVHPDLGIAAMSGSLGDFERNRRSVTASRPSPSTGGLFAGAPTSSRLRLKIPSRLGVRAHHADHRGGTGNAVTRQRLCSPSEVRSEEHLGSSIEVGAVFGARETMTLVGI